LNSWTFSGDQGSSPLVLGGIFPLETTVDLYESAMHNGLMSSSFVTTVSGTYDPHDTIPNDPVTFGCTRYVGVVAARLDTG